MDVNMNAEVKGFGAPAIPAVEMEERSRVRITTVQQSSDSSGAGVDSRLLQRGGGARKAEEQLNAEKLAGYVEDVQQRFDTMGTTLNFSLDSATDSLVVTVTDKESGELVRQIPPESLLELKAKLDDLVGLLFDEKA